MHGGRPLLEDVALVLCVAAITTVIFRRLRQPVVLGYLLAGVIVGPHTPIPLFADKERIQTLSELGVIFVMFSVGLEFSFRKLVRVVPTSGIVGLIQISTMILLGYQAGQLFGWTARESLFTGAIVAISSTMIVAKVFAEQRVDRNLTDAVFGVLVVQDLAAILLLATLTAISTGHGQTSTVLAQTAGQLVAFLLAIVMVGFLVVPRAIRAISNLKSPETLLVASIAICFAFALIAHKVGYSVALGAFLAGSLVAESGEAEHVERLIMPVRDMFAAIFFVAVGMVLDPRVVIEHWRATIVLVVVVVVGQFVSTSVGAFLSGRDIRTSVRTAMSLAQIGEFSFIVASVGVASGAIRSFLYPLAVAVSVVTTFMTPWLIRASRPVAIYVDHRLPKPLQTFVSLYGSWLEQLRSTKVPGRRRKGVASLVVLLAVDAAMLAGIVIGASLGMNRLLGSLQERFHVLAQVGRSLVIGGAILLSIPFVLGIMRLARSLGARLAEAALPEADRNKTDLAAAPRRAFVVTLQLAIVLLVGIPLLVITQPFLPPLAGVAGLVIVLGVLGVGFWRSATNLQAHVQAGAEMIVEALGKQSVDKTSLDQVHSLLPGLGDFTPVQLGADSVAIGKTLAQINLRALTGASVITLLRDGKGIKPTPSDPLRQGDVLALAGTHEAIDAATSMLRGGEPQGGSDQLSE